MATKPILAKPGSNGNGNGNGNGGAEHTARNILRLYVEGRTIVPPLHRGHEEQWVTDNGDVLDIYRKTANNIFDREHRKMEQILKTETALNIEKARLAASMKDSAPLISGIVALINELDDEISTGPRVPHNSVEKFRKELDAELTKIAANEASSNKKLAEILAQGRVGETIIGLAPGLRLRTQLLKYGATAVAIVGVPFAVVEGLDTQITEAIRQYTLTGAGAVAVIFLLLRIPSLYVAYQHTKEIHETRKQAELLENAVPLRGIPRFKPNPILSRPWYRIWNERWADWRYRAENTPPISYFWNKYITPFMNTHFPKYTHNWQDEVVYAAKAPGFDAENIRE